MLYSLEGREAMMGERKVQRFCDGLAQIGEEEIERQRKYYRGL